MSQEYIRCQRKQSQSTIQKRQEALRGIRRTPEFRAKVSAGKNGKPRPDVTEWAPERFAMFDEPTVFRIRADRERGMTYRAIAEKHDCNVSTAFSVVNGVGRRYSSV